MAVSICMLAVAACTNGGSETTAPGDGEATATAETLIDPIAVLTNDLGVPDSVEEAPNGGTLTVWLVPEASAEGLARDLAARVEKVEGLVAASTEIGQQGGVLVFEGTRSGHFLVSRSTARETRVELYLDVLPEAPAPSAERTAVALPTGYPVATLPPFPGSFIVAASSAPDATGASRFEVDLQSERTPLEVLGFYGDYLTAEGWSVTVGAEWVRATRADVGTSPASISITVVGSEPTTVRLELALPGPPPTTMATATS